MSSQYRLDFVWASHGQQLRADLERSIGTLSRQRSELRRHSQEMGRWQQQMRAIGTTLRYAIAGGTVYAVAAAVSRLGELEAKLGEIDSLAARLDERGNLIGLGKQLDEVGDFALATSDKFGIAANDITQHMSRFYSSFDVPAGRRSLQQLEGFTTEMANMSLLAEGADPMALAGGIAGMIRGIPGFDEKTTDIAGQTKRFTNIIAELTRLSPVITGADIARDVGRLGSAQTAMNMTPEQIFAVYGAASLKGGSPAVIGRGITQLLSSELLKPQTDAQKQAFRTMGLPTDPNALRQMGGWQVLQQMLTRVAGTTITDPAALRNEALTDEEALLAAGAQGPDVTLASKAFGRQESFRQFLNLLSVGGVDALDNFIDSIKEAEDTNRGQQRVDLIQDRRYMQRAQQAQANLTTQITRGFRPVFEQYSRAIGFVSRTARENPTATTAVLVGGAGAVVGSRLMRGMASRGVFGKFGRMGRLGSILGGAGAVADTAMMGAMAAEAAPSILSGQGAGTRPSPYWVLIHPLSWQMPGAPTGLGGPGGGVGPAAGGPGKKGGGLGKAALVGGGALAIASMPFWMQGDEGDTDKDILRKRFYERNPKFGEWLKKNRGGLGKIPREQFGDVLEQMFAGKLSMTKGQQRLLGMVPKQGVPGDPSQNFMGLRDALLQLSAGETIITMKLEPTGDLAKLLKGSESKVPVKLWGSTAATYRGRPRNVRGGD